MLSTLLHWGEDIGLTRLFIEEGFITARERAIEWESSCRHKFHDFARQVELTDRITPES